MKKIFFLIIPFLIFSCSNENNNKEYISTWKIEKENSFPYSDILKINLLWEDSQEWKNTLKFLYQNSNSLIIWVDKKENLIDLKWIWKQKFYSLNIKTKTNIFWKEILNYLNWTNWEILTFDLKSEEIKDFKLSNEEKEIFEKLNFKTKEIYINWNKYE